MKIINNLTEQDMLRSLQIPQTASMLAGSWLSLIEGCDLFASEMVNPLIQIGKNLTQRETALGGLYYRIIAFCKSATVLKAIVHQQTITSAERSVLELYVDMELLHRGIFSDGIDRAITFIEVQKLKAARRVVRFFADNPSLDSTPTFAAPHLEFIKSSEALVEAKAAILWGTNKANKPILPEHWSGLNLPERVAKLDKAMELRVLQGYDMRNFAVHTGLAGVVNFEKAHLEMQCALSLKGIGECAAGALKIIGQEFGLYKALPDFFDRLAEVENIPTFAITDKKLQSIGEEPRFFLHKELETSHKNLTA